MSESSPYADASAASSLLSHLYLTPVLVELVRGGVPDHLDQGPLHASDLAKRAELNEISVTRALRALAAFGAFQEFRSGCLQTILYLSSFAIGRVAFGTHSSSGVPSTSFNLPQHSAIA